MREHYIGGLSDKDRKSTIFIDTRPVLSVVVYGPKGCGKTRNAIKIAAAYGLRRIFDNYSGTFNDVPSTDALILTNMKLAKYKSASDLKFVTFDDALKYTGNSRS